MDPFGTIPGEKGVGNGGKEQGTQEKKKDVSFREVGSTQVERAGTQESRRQRETRTQKERAMIIKEETHTHTDTHSHTHTQTDSFNHSFIQSIIH